jgi:hypothetical protein
MNGIQEVLLIFEILLEEQHSVLELYRRLDKHTFLISMIKQYNAPLSNRRHRENKIQEL